MYSSSMVQIVTRLQGQNTGVSVPRLSTYSRLPSPRVTATGWKNPFPPRVSWRPMVWLYWNVNGSICVIMFASHRYLTHQLPQLCQVLRTGTAYRHWPHHTGGA